MTHEECERYSKSPIRACVKLVLEGGITAYYRHTDRHRAHMIAGRIARRMVEVARGDPNAVPVLESTVLMDNFVEFQNPTKSNLRNDIHATVGYGKVEYSQSCVRIDKIIMVAVVCPNCGLYVMDSLPGHVIENGDCSDPLMDGTT